MKLLQGLLPSLTLVSTLAAALPTEPVEFQGDESKALTARGKPEDNYIFAVFNNKNEGKSNEESWLDIYSGSDGINWDELYMSAYKPANGLIRDPSIIKRNNMWYIAHTIGWKGDSFAIIESSDLKNWKLINTILVKGSEVTWAPEWFEDPDGSLHIIVSARIRPGTGALNKRAPIGAPPPPTKPIPLNAVRFTLAKDAKDPSGRWDQTKFDVNNHGSGVNEDHIDMFVIKDGDTYHGWQKNDHEKHIEHLTSKSLEGTWEYVQTNDKLGFGKMEAPSIFKNKDGWVMYMDNYHGQYFYSTSKGLDGPWSKPQGVPKYGDRLRHGTVFQQNK